MEGAALSEYFLPSAVSTSALMLLTHSGFSIWLSSLAWIATMVLPCWPDEATLVMASDAPGVLRLEKTTTDTTTATSTAAISSGTIGGSVHLALSISSVIGMCPASGREADAAALFGGLAGCGVWLGFSGINRSRYNNTLLRC